MAHTVDLIDPMLAATRIHCVSIPSIGDVLTLAHDWTFTAYAEYRNKALMEYLVESGAIPPRPDGRAPWSYGRELDRYSCTIPAGCKLRVDRIYIRRGKADYDSLTFWAQGLSKKRVRFWAKLAEVNRMLVTDDPEFTPAASTEPPRIRAIRLRE